MNNVIKFSYIYFPHSKDFLLITAIGKLIFKFLFYWKYKYVKNALGNQVKYNLTKRLEDRFCENFSNIELLLFHAPIRNDYNFPQHGLIFDDKRSMKLSWNVLSSYLFDIFEFQKTIQGVSVENDVFVVRNRAIIINKSSRTISSSIDLIFESLVNKFLKLLFCPEIIDLIIEKNHLKKLNLSVVEKTDELFIDKIDENYLRTQQDSTDRTDSITSFTVISSGKITLNDTKYEFNNSDMTNSDTPEWKLSKIECQAAGDINRIPAPNNNYDEDKISEKSRISKAENWIKDNRAIENNKLNIKTPSQQKITKSKPLQSKQKAAKLPRFIVKKSESVVKNSTNNSSTNLTNRKKQVKLRFTVLKNKSISQEIPIKEEKKKPKEKPFVKSNKTPRFTDPNILSSIRQDVLNLANELQQNYLRHSRTNRIAKESTEEKLSEIPRRDLMLEEVRKRLLRKPKFKNTGPIKNNIENDEFCTTDTLTDINSINSKIPDSFNPKYDATLSILSSSNNPFNSTFLTASDNTITSYKSIVSSTDNSPCLNTLDLRDIHLISDQIHGLAQKELMKIC